MTGTTMTDSYIYVITALLPLSACMLVVQVNPYHALVIRGILGAVAALVYTVLGAADVALTEALVGTMLAVTLYAVAVRSSLVLRLGVLTEESAHTPADLGGAIAPDSLPESVENADRKVGSGQRSAHRSSDPRLQALIADLRAVFNKHHIRLELVPYTTPQALERALMAKEIHAACSPSDGLIQAEQTWAERSALVEQLSSREPLRSDSPDQSPVAQTLAARTGEKPFYRTATRLQRIYDILTAELSTPSRVTYVPASDAQEVHS